MFYYSDTDDDSKRGLSAYPLPDRSSPPPPLNDIPHILPSPVASPITTPQTSFSQIIPSIHVPVTLGTILNKHHVNDMTTITSINRTYKESLKTTNPIGLSSSSNDSQMVAIKLSTNVEKKKKLRKRRNSRDGKRMSPLKTGSSRKSGSSNDERRHLPVQLMESSSSLSEEDVFDPGIVL